VCLSIYLFAANQHCAGVSSSRSRSLISLSRVRFSNVWVCVWWDSYNHLTICLCTAPANLSLCHGLSPPAHDHTPHRYDRVCVCVCVCVSSVEAQHSPLLPIHTFIYVSMYTYTHLCVQVHTYQYTQTCTCTCASRNYLPFDPKNPKFKSKF